MSIRRATIDDFDVIAELEKYVYSMPPDYIEVSHERFPYTYDDHLLYEKDGRVVATLRLIPLHQNIRGLWKKMGAIAMVTSAPENRRLGHVRQLMQHSFEFMHEEGYATSMLYPFKDTFYGSFGYVNCPPRIRVETNPNHLSRWKMPKGYRIERMALEAALDYYKEIHFEFGKNTHGATKRSDKRWKEIAASSRLEVAVAFGKSDDFEGIMLYHHSGYSDFAGEANLGKMIVREWYWKNANARSALLNFVFLHSDQLVKAVIPANPEIDEYYQWIEGRNILELKTGLTYMARCVDAQVALEGLPASADGQLTFRIKDPYCKWNNQTFWLDANGGSIKAEPIGDADTDGLMTIEGLTALVFGTMAPASLQAYGWIEGVTPSILDEWFPRRYVWMYEDF